MKYTLKTKRSIKFNTGNTKILNPKDGGKVEKKITKNK